MPTTYAEADKAARAEQQRRIDAQGKDTSVRVKDSKINQGSLGEAAGEKGGADTDPEPKAKDFKSLGEWGAARTAWQKRRQAAPQAKAIENLRARQ